MTDFAEDFHSWLKANKVATDDPEFREVEELKTLLAAAKKYDEATGLEANWFSLPESTLREYPGNGDEP